MVEGCGAKRVAILDIDYHHGNGTQEIFLTAVMWSLHPFTETRNLSTRFMPDTPTKSEKGKGTGSI